MHGKARGAERQEAKWLHNSFELYLGDNQKDMFDENQSICANIYNFNVEIL
jgi:hypothetical protein